MQPTGFIRHFEDCNRHNVAAYVPFYMGDVALGHIEQGEVNDLVANINGFQKVADGVALSNNIKSFDERSATLAAATAYLCKRRNKRLRNELFPVLGEWGDEPLAALDRRAVPWFGVRAFGVHVNGFVTKNGEPYLWIGERGKSRGVEPGKFDNMVGGGQPIGISIRENVRKEAEEEACLPPEIADMAKHVTTLCYRMERNEGLRDDTLFIFDLEMPEGVTPTNTNGEVAAFHLLPAREVGEIVRTTDRFKFNCNLVVIDFLVRHGVITPDHPEYASIIAYLKPARPRHSARISPGVLPLD